MKQLKKPRPGLQGVTFAPAENESDGLDARGPEIGDQSDVSQMCKVGQVPVLGMISSLPRIKTITNESGFWSSARMMMVVINVYTAMSKRSAPRITGGKTGEVT